MLGIDDVSGADDVSGVDEVSGADNAAGGLSLRSHFPRLWDLIFSFWREAVQMTMLADSLALLEYIFGGHSYDVYYSGLTSSLKGTCLRNARKGQVLSA